MTPEQVLDVAREAIFVLIKIGAPIMLVALVVGVLIALLQALTQMQEMTLSFVPKILAIFLTVVLALPFMIATLVGFGEELFQPHRRPRLSRRARRPMLPELVAAGPVRAAADLRAHRQRVHGAAGLRRGLRRARASGCCWRSAMSVVAGRAARRPACRRCRPRRSSSAG